jgi:hypothetical protein
MKSSTEITLLPLETVVNRRESGLIVPMNEGRGLQVIDCSDDRLQRNITAFEPATMVLRYIQGAFLAVQAALPSLRLLRLQHSAVKVL